MAPPVLGPAESPSSQYFGDIAQILRTLTPNVSLLFVPVGKVDDQGRGIYPVDDLLEALDKALSEGASIIVLPLRPKGFVKAAGLMMAKAVSSHNVLLIIPAGNKGLDEPSDSEFQELSKYALFASSLSLDGKLSEFSSAPIGALAVVGEGLPVAVVDDRGIEIERRSGTGPATAVLAAIAIEAKVRFPNVSVSELARVLHEVARKLPAQSAVPVAVVP
jgi:hypothetical protein